MELLVGSLHSSNILFAKGSILNVWQCYDYASVLITTQRFVQWPYAMYYSRHNQDSTFTIIFSIIKAYSRIFSLIQGYLASFVTLAYSQTCHIPSPGILRTGGILKTLWNFEQAYSEPCHNQYSQNSLCRHYSVIFRTLCNIFICRNLAYSESWNIY